MKALCACKTDERTVNGNIRAAESQARNVKDEKILGNMDRVGDERMNHKGHFRWREEEDILWAKKKERQNVIDNVFDHNLVTF